MSAVQKVIPLKPLSAWSFSRWNKYETCPAKLRFDVYDRLKEPSNEAMERGTAIHKQHEDYILRNGELTADIKRFKTLLDDLKKRAKAHEEVLVEDSWTFRKDWSMTSATDWNGAWLRA